MTPLKFENGVYRTAQRRISLWARWFPSLAFHAQYIMTILRSASRAKQGRYDSNAWAQSSLRVMRALEGVGVQFEITGREHLEEIDGPCLVIGNHNSSLETTVLPCVIQPVKEVTFVVKQALLTVPIFKHVMRTRDPIAVTQTDPRADLKRMLAGAKERLARGVSLVIFPEGERATKFDKQRFNSIGVKIAERNDVPIVPLALDTNAWQLGRILSDFGKIDRSKTVRFAFGPPLRVEGRGAEERQFLIDYIEQHLEQWQATDSSRSGTASRTLGTQ